jgi:hypothetical protein
MDPTLGIMLMITVFAIGWICGCKWVHWQWEHCGHSDTDMRVNGKHLYRVEYLGVERKVKV